MHANFKRLMVAAFLMLVLGYGTAFGQQGEALYISKGCVACHGDRGQRPIGGLYPVLAGQNKAYLTAQLLAFKRLERAGGNATVMYSFAVPLNEQEIEALASYLSQTR